MASDWYDIKFLESATNVRELIGRSTGRTPSASVAREISVCVQQGRLFFEAAEAAPIQIKPLQIYYGKALTEAREAGARVKIGKDGGIEIDFGKTGTADNPDVSQDTPESVKALI